MPAAARYRAAGEPSPPAPGRSRLYPPRHPLPEFGCDTHVHVLGPFSRFPLSSPRAYSPGPASVTDLQVVWQTTRACGLPVFILGRGSNLIVPDEGVDGVVVSLALPAWSAFEPRPGGRR